jgi:hypothetical protein
MDFLIEMAKLLIAGMVSTLIVVFMFISIYSMVDMMNKYEKNQKRNKDQD